MAAAILRVQMRTNRKGEINLRGVGWWHLRGHQGMGGTSQAESAGQRLCEGNKLMCLRGRNKVGGRIIRGGRWGKVGRRGGREGGPREWQAQACALKRTPGREGLIGTTV